MYINYADYQVKQSLLPFALPAHQTCKFWVRRGINRDPAFAGLVGGKTSLAGLGFATESKVWI